MVQCDKWRIILLRKCGPHVAKKDPTSSKINTKRNAIFGVDFTKRNNKKRRLSFLFYILSQDPQSLVFGSFKTQLNNRTTND